MRRLLSSVGIGSATVDTILERERLEPGETVDLSVEIHGGSTAQEVDGIYFALETEYLDEDGDRETTAIERTEAAEGFTIEPDAERTLSASMTLPRVTPLTRGDVDVWLRTGLDVDWARDPRDRDHVEVVPDEQMAAVLDAVESIGFAFSESDCKRASVYSPAPFVQEFEYEPTNSEWRRKIDELEVIFAPLADELEVRVEVDRRDATYVDLTGAEERNEWLTITDERARNLRSDLRSFINQKF